jgi:hypothetical protein
MVRNDAFFTAAERWGPYAAGAIALAVGVLAHDWASFVFEQTGMNGKDAIGASFNVMVTLTAFLFSVFVLAIAPGGGFLQTIFNTQTFSIFKRYVVEALVLGSIASAWSLPFMSTQMGVGIWQLGWADTVWSAVTISAVFAFVRVAHIFLTWVSLSSRGNGGRDI